MCTTRKKKIIKKKTIVICKTTQEKNNKKKRNKTFNHCSHSFLHLYVPSSFHRYPLVP